MVQVWHPSQGHLWGEICKLEQKILGLLHRIFITSSRICESTWSINLFWKKTGTGYKTTNLKTWFLLVALNWLYNISSWLKTSMVPPRFKYAAARSVWCFLCWNRRRFVRSKLHRGETPQVLERSKLDSLGSTGGWSTNHGVPDRSCSQKITQKLHYITLYRWYMLVYIYIYAILPQGYPTFPFDSID